MSLSKIVSLPVMIILILSCNSEPKSNLYQNNQGSISPENGGTLVVGLAAEPDALNPLIALSETSREVIGLVFRRLADLNPDLVSFKPQLAKCWQFSEDSLSICFFLRNDVVWHDGVAFTAEDVVFTFRMQTDPLIAWDGASFKELIRNVEVVNDSAVIFHFSRSSASMLMDAVEGYIVPAHLLEQIPADEMHRAEFNRQPIGCGPFRFKEWRFQQLIHLIKYDQYYESAKPHLDRVIFKIIPDNISLALQLQKGEIDLAQNIAPQDFQRFSELWAENKSEIKPYAYLGRHYDFIGWNLIDPQYYQNGLLDFNPSYPDFTSILKPNQLFGSQKVRAALTMALDREKIAQIVNKGLGIPMHGPVPPILWAYNETANHHWVYDPNQALQLFAKEGWRDTDADGILDKNGYPFEFEMLTNSGNVRREQALLLIQDQLRKVKVLMHPRIVEQGVLLGQLLPNKEFDAVLIGWTVGLKVDFAPLFHSSTLLIPFHFTGFYSPEYDELERQAKSNLNRTTAQQSWDRIAALLSYELPYTWLYYRLENTAIHRRFRDVIIDQRGAFNNLEDWWVPVQERSHTDQYFGE
jgi:peptide/nickel transport system substrate-binding protein